VKPRSLVLRLTLAQLMLAAAILVVFAASAITLSARALEREETTVLARASQQMVVGLQREWDEEHDLGRAAASALEEDAPPGIRVDIWDDHGHLIHSTAHGRPTTATSEQRQLRAHVARGAWVVTTISTRPRWHALETLAISLLLAAVPLFLLLMLLSGSLARRALEPLSRMTEQVEQAGTYGALAPLGRPSDPHEVGVLAQAFHRLLERLEQAL